MKIGAMIHKMRLKVVKYLLYYQTQAMRGEEPERVLSGYWSMLLPVHPTKDATNLSSARYMFCVVFRDQ